MPPLADWRTQYKHRFYESRPDWQPIYPTWIAYVTRHLPANGTVLEIGGGPSQDLTRHLRPHAATLLGLDIDPVLTANPLLDRAIVYDGGRFPELADDSIDVAVAEWVNEHLPDPAAHVREVARVLKPGGRYIVRTVNLWHYKALGAWLLPHRLQVRVARWLRHSASEDYDPYPVYYRANRARVIQRLCAHAGLRLVQYDTLESIPAYGFSARPVFWLFMGYERLVNATPILAGWRHTIQFVAVKS